MRRRVVTLSGRRPGFVGRYSKGLAMAEFHLTCVLVTVLLAVATHFVETLKR